MLNDHSGNTAETKGLIQIYKRGYVCLMIIPEILLKDIKKTQEKEKRERDVEKGGKK